MKKDFPLSIICFLTWPLLAAEPADKAALAYWPGWRGPLASGVAPQADPPLTWSETNNVRWKVKIPGTGTATPILWEDKLFILTAVPTGRKLDPREAAARKAPLATLPSGGAREVSPNVEPPQDFFRFTVLCLDRQTGETLWEKPGACQGCGVRYERLPEEGALRRPAWKHRRACRHGCHAVDLQPACAVRLLATHRGRFDLFRLEHQRTPNLPERPDG